MLTSLPFGLNIYTAIVFLPLLGALIAGFLGRLIGARPAELITTIALMAACALSWVALVQVGYKGNAVRAELFTWISSGTMTVNWALRVDTLTAVMLVVVTTVSALVHLYSIGYMHEDESRQRFFSYLSLFTFAMLMLVTADNFLQLFFGWEGVGLASYLLIGFWFKKPTANAAAMKAFIVNRVGDFGFALGIFGVFVLFGSINFETVFAAAKTSADKSINFLWFEAHALTVICLLLFMGAMGKSAQFLLHTWLPDAMEGPTPVSALIHAATMVTAGVFMVVRLSPMFELAPFALQVVTVFGAITAFFAATVGLVQNDIKRVIAYSTCSQLGYMFAACGVGAYTAGMFHLFTHAFFKALLFLGAGAVIHSMHHEQDIRHMGGLRKAIPFTYAMMTIGTLALTGFPYTAGYFSKDAIIEATYAAHSGVGNFAFYALVTAALFTSFYSWRLVFLTFHGTFRGAHHSDHHDAHATHDDHHHGVSSLKEVHESPKVMLVPLLVLAIGALLAGIVFKEQFVGHHVAEFFRGAVFMAQSNTILEAMHHVPSWVVWSPFVAMVAGFVLAWLMYIVWPDMPHRIAQQHDVAYRFLLNKWYFDELYDIIFVRPAKWLGYTLWKKGDGFVIDGFGPDGVSSLVQKITARVVRLQSGFLYHYAFAMLLGVAGFITWMMFHNSAIGGH